MPYVSTNLKQVLMDEKHFMKCLVCWIFLPEKGKSNT